jgi:DNA-binding transcriptional MerR regulator
MTDRSYLSIGDVLSLLKEEFPDVTISKIRFLESQGLLDPERTPSGYRKFYPPDVERLRWILRQQKEHFLPLKVIKGRLEPSSEEGGAAGPEAVADAPLHPPAEAEASGGTEAMASVASASESNPAPTPETLIGAVGEPASSVSRPVRPDPKLPRRPPMLGALGRDDPSRRRTAPPNGHQNGREDVSVTFEELVAASQLSEAQVRELEQYGLISGRTVARTVYYDAEAVAVAAIAGEMSRFGVEARHLRMYKTAADREAGFFEQIVTPLLKQRNPRSRQQAVQTVQDLAELGERLRRSMLRIALGDLTGG